MTLPCGCNEHTDAQHDACDAARFLWEKYRLPVILGMRFVDDDGDRAIHCAGVGNHVEMVVLIRALLAAIIKHDPKGCESCIIARSAAIAAKAYLDYIDPKPCK